MQQQSESQTNAADRLRNSFNIIAFIARCFAVICEVIMHTGFGSRYLGLHAFGGFLLIPSWSIFWPRNDPTLLLLFWAAYVLALVKARLDIVRRALRGDMEHSRYNGTPTLLRKHPTWNELSVKRFVEPGIVLAGGLTLAGTVDPVLGSFLIFAAIGLFVSVNVNEAVDRARAQNAFDSMLDQEQMARRVRKMRGDRS